MVLWRLIFLLMCDRNVGDAGCALNPLAQAELEKHIGEHAFITIDEMKSRHSFIFQCDNMVY